MLHTLYPFEVVFNGRSPHEALLRTEAELDEYVQQENPPLRGWLKGLTPEAEHDVKELNLNAPRLVSYRATVIEQLRKDLERNRGKERRFIQDRLRTARLDPQAPGKKLPAYAHIELAYLQKKAHAHGLHLPDTG